MLPAAEVLAWLPGKTVADAERHVTSVLPDTKPRETIVPIDGESYLASFVITEQAGIDLEELRNILSFAVPSGARGEVLAYVMDFALPALRARRYAGLLEPEVPRGTSDGGVAAASTGARTRHIPREVARVVYERDEHCCTYRGANGRRCCETWQTQLHHIIPWGAGGPSTVENLTVYCYHHNLLAAQEDYGREHMDQFTQGGP